MQLPEPYTDLKERFPDLMAADEALGAQAANAGPLSERDQRLVKLGLPAMVRGMTWVQDVLED